MPQKITLKSKVKLSSLDLTLDWWWWQAGGETGGVMRLCNYIRALQMKDWRCCFQARRRSWKTQCNHGFLVNINKSLPVTQRPATVPITSRCCVFLCVWMIVFVCARHLHGSEDPIIDIPFGISKLISTLLPLPPLIWGEDIDCFVTLPWGWLELLIKNPNSAGDCMGLNIQFLVMQNKQAELLWDWEEMEPSHEP